MMSIEPAEDIKKPRGRPRKLAVEKEVHARDGSVTNPNGGVQVRGRDGEILTRTRTDDGIDPYHVPNVLIEKGWEMQWIALSVYGNKEVVSDDHQMMMQNGWRPVQADRPGFKGRYMPAEYTGHIVRGSLGLYERPAALNDEARRENQKKAYQQLRDRDEQLTGRRANLRGQMPAGFELNDNANTYRGRKTQLSMDDSLSGFAPRPEHKLAEPGE